MKRYIIILVLLMAFYPWIGGQTGCHGGEITGDFAGDDAEVLADSVEGADSADAEAQGDAAEKAPDAAEEEELECPVPPEKRQFPACANIIPIDSDANFIFDYDRLIETVESLPSSGPAQFFVEKLTEEIDPLAILGDLSGADSICISCDFKTQAQVQAIASNPAFAGLPALQKVYGVCKDVLVVYSFGKDWEDQAILPLLAESIGGVDQGNGVYAFPTIPGVKAQQIKGTVLFGSDSFFNAALQRLNAGDESPLIGSLRYYLPAGLIYSLPVEFGVMAPAKVKPLLKTLALLMPMQFMAYKDQAADYAFALDAYGGNVKLGVGMYGPAGKALALAQTTMDVDGFQSSMLAMKEYQLAVDTKIKQSFIEGAADGYKMGAGVYGGAAGYAHAWFSLALLSLNNAATNAGISLAITPTTCNAYTAVSGYNFMSCPESSTSLSPGTEWYCGCIKNGVAANCNVDLKNNDAVCATLEGLDGIINYSLSIDQCVEQGKCFKFSF